MKKRDKIGFGERLVVIMSDRDKKAFADSIGISPSTLRRWTHEDGLPDIGQVKDMSEVLKLNPAWVSWGFGSPHLDNDQTCNSAIAAPEELKGEGQKQIEPPRIVAQEFTSNTDQPSSPPITVPEHKEDERKQTVLSQVAPQEPQGMPARTQLAVLCCFLAIIFTFILNKSNVEFFKNYSVFGVLLSCAIGYFCISLPYMEKWFYRAPKNLGV